MRDDNGFRILERSKGIRAKGINGLRKYCSISELEKSSKFRNTDMVILILLLDLLDDFISSSRLIYSELKLN